MLYQIDNKKTPAYTINQLQPVDENAINAPPANLVIHGNPGDYNFIVKEILDKRKVKGKVEYLIKWKDFKNLSTTITP